MEKCKYFKEIADIFSFFLSYKLDEELYEDVIIIITALCDIIKQRIYFDKINFKTLIT